MFNIVDKINVHLSSMLMCIQLNSIFFISLLFSLDIPVLLRMVVTLNQLKTLSISFIMMKMRKEREEEMQLNQVMERTKRLVGSTPCVLIRYCTVFLFPV